MRAGRIVSLVDLEAVYLQEFELALLLLKGLVLIHDFILISDCFCYYNMSAFEATKII